MNLAEEFCIDFSPPQLSILVDPANDRAIAQTPRVFFALALPSRAN
jgi:hypothetical protein